MNWWRRHDPKTRVLPRPYKFRTVIATRRAIEIIQAFRAAGDRIEFQRDNPRGLLAIVNGAIDVYADGRMYSWID